MYVIVCDLVSGANRPVVKDLINLLAVYWVLKKE